MSRTLKIGGIRFDNEDDKSYVHEYMVQYNHVYRCAFNKFFNGQTTSQLSLANQLNHIDLLDSWWISSAITDAKTAVKSLKKSNPDIEKVVFGGRRNFIRLCQGKMDKDTWKMNTYVPLSSIGEKASGSKQLKGNRKFKILSDLQTVTILVKGKKK